MPLPRSGRPKPATMWWLSLIHISILRLVELDEVVEKHFLEGNRLTIVGADTYIYKQAIFLLHFVDRHGPVFVAGYLIAHIEADPGDRCLFFGIHAVFTGSRKQQGNHASFNSCLLYTSPEVHPW